MQVFTQNMVPIVSVGVVEVKHSPAEALTKYCVNSMHRIADGSNEGK